MSANAVKFSTGQFHPLYTVQTGDERWELGSYTDKSGSYAVAMPESRQYAIKLDVHSLLKQNPERVSFQKIFHGTPNYLPFEPESQLDQYLCQGLVELATEAKLFGRAEPGAGLDVLEDGYGMASHTFRFDGQTWVVGMLDKGDDCSVYAIRQLPDGVRQVVEQYPALSDENGIVAPYLRIRELNGPRAAEGWRDLSHTDGVSKRLLKDMLEFANTYQHFGTLEELQAKPLQEQFESSFVEKERQRRDAYTKNGVGGLSA